MNSANWIYSMVHIYEVNLNLQYVTLSWWYVLRFGHFTMILLPTFELDE